MQEYGSGEAMAALAEATAVQAEVAHQRQAFMWAQMVFAQAIAPRRWSTPTPAHCGGPSRHGGEAMKRAAVVVILWLVTAFSMGIVTAVNAGEPFSGPVQQMEGQVKAINFACHAMQGVCEGSMVVAERRRGDVPLVIRPGTQIRRGEQPVTLHELELGAPIKAFAFQMSGEQLPRVVLIEVTDVREPLATP
jgi:hypothetical protein